MKEERPVEDLRERRQGQVRDEQSVNQWAPHLDDPDPPAKPMSDEQLKQAAKAARQMLIDEGCQPHPRDRLTIGGRNGYRSEAGLRSSSRASSSLKIRQRLLVIDREIGRTRTSGREITSFFEKKFGYH